MTLGQYTEKFDVTAPFHAPRFTDEQFAKMREEYIAKHGYTVTIPALSDIIHIVIFPAMTKREKQLWAQRRYDEIPPNRRRAIRAEKARKHAKFLAMLGDPSPDIARSAGAILTAIDDTQDAVSTLACIGMIAAAVIGGTTAAAVLGPLGLILGASTFMNIINPYSHLRKLLKKSSSGRGAKKNMEKLTDKNPFSKKAKVKLAKKLLKFRPTLGNLIEAAQTTDQIFGIGICLGPIIGFAQGALSGAIRTAMGEEVEWKKGWPEKSEAEKAAAHAMVMNVMLHMNVWMSDKDDEMRSMVSSCLAMQVLYKSVEEWNPLDHIENIGSYLVQAPQPTDPLTLELIAESGIPIEKLCVWPQTGKQWISIDDIYDHAIKNTASNLAHYAAQNNHDLGAFNALACADDFALNFLGAFEGQDQVEVEWLSTERIMICILDNGWEYPDGVTEAQVQKFEDWVYVHEYMNTNPSAKEIMYYAQIHCGFTWARSKREFR